MQSRIYLNVYRVAVDEKGAPIELRRGSGGATYKAQDIITGGEATLDIVPAVALSPAIRERLESEATAAKLLTHINIPRVYDFGFDGDLLVYAIEHFDGTPADSWVATHGPMPAAAVLRIALQVVNALGAAALKGIVHHAINPRNLMLVPGQTPEGDWPLVKLLNLVGIAPAFSAASSAGMEAEFSRKFASPGQLQDGAVDFRSEIYSLGRTLWFLITGHIPVPGGSIERVPGVPKAVAHLIARMVSSDREERPLDPLAFQEELRDCLAHVERRDALGRKFGVPAAAVPVVKPRRPIRAGALALAASILALAGLAALVVRGDLKTGRLFSWQDKPIGVPIGVSENALAPEGGQEAATPVTAPPGSADVIAAANPTTAPAESPGSAPTPESALSSPPQLVAKSSPEASAAPAIEPAPAAPQPAVSPQPDTSLAYTSAPEPNFSGATPGAVDSAGNGEPTQQFAAHTAGSAAEAPPPAEGPADAASAQPPAPDASPAVAAQAPPDTDVPASISLDEPAQKSGAPKPANTRSAATAKEKPPVKTERPARSRKPVKRIAGKEVRPAEPVFLDDLPVMPALPPTSRRAKFVGVGPDGDLIFEMPSSERGYVEPPPVYPPEDSPRRRLRERVFTPPLADDVPLPDDVIVDENE